MRKTVQVSTASLLAWLVAGIASAQTTTPAVPNTGVGGEMFANLFLLVVMAAVAVAGIAYLSRKWAKS